MFDEELFFVVKLREGIYLLVSRNHPEEVFNPDIHFPEPLLEGRDHPELLLPYFSE